MSFKKLHRAATVIAGLLCGLASATALGPLAGVASAVDDQVIP